MKKYLHPFQNVKFNIWLFVALALASILGTLIPQVHDNLDGVHAFTSQSPNLAAVFQKIGLFNIYYSLWFKAMLALMAFDVVVCKILFGKYPGWRTFKKNEGNLEAIERQPYKMEWKTPASPEENFKKMERVLNQMKYSLRVEPKSRGSFLILASRHRMQRFGSWVSHISILLILLANLTGALYGFRETVNIPEGQSARLANRPWVVACDKFIVDWYPGTSTPKTFASDLRLFVEGKLAREGRILVNEPMQHKKVRFYQATYGPYLKSARIGFFMKSRGVKSPVVNVGLNEDVPVPGTTYSLRILEFSPDFTFSPEAGIRTLSSEPRNPAVQVLVMNHGKPYKAPWIMQSRPALEMPPPNPKDDVILILADYDHSYYTGLQVTYDPGADLFWLACAILVLSLATLFYFHHRKLWIYVKPAETGRGSEVLFGAYSSRGTSFELDFQNLARKFQS